MFTFIVHCKRYQKNTNPLSSKDKRKLTTVFLKNLRADLVAIIIWQSIA